MSKISLIKGDITKLSVDAIVNAANNSLLGGGGVDGAIYKAGGLAILEACTEIRKRQGGCATGEAVITTGENYWHDMLFIQLVLFGRGGGKNEVSLLRNCYNNSLLLAEQHQINRIAFPNISTGVYHFPKEKAADIAIKAVRDFLTTHVLPSEIIFACFEDENYSVYRRLLN